MNTSLNDHPFNSAELRANFKKDTGLDWNERISDFLLYVNIAVVKGNAGAIRKEITKVKDELFWLKGALTKK